MSLFSRFVAIALAVTFLPSVLAHGDGGGYGGGYGGGGGGGYGGNGGGYGGNGGGKQCAESEFWYESKKCCLPVGGPPTKPTPPKDTDCPSSHYWGKDKGCCLPHKPDDDDDNPPCPISKWKWVPGHWCEPPPPTTTVPPSQPSQYPVGGGYGGNGGGYGGHGGYGPHKRSGLKSRAVPLCPFGLTACPIPGMTAGDFQCMDTTSDLEACGGCPSLGEGQDCSAIEGAWNVACEALECKIYSCAPGHMKSYDGKTCVSI